MKNTIILTTALLLASVLQAQDIDRTKAPKPGPAPTINIPDPASFTLTNGLKVYVVRNTKLPMVTATLLIDRDPLVEGDKSGMSEMAGSLMRRGTTTMDKAALDEAIDYLGGNISSSATSVNASSLKKNFPALMKLMADVALRPALGAAELEKVRTQTLSGLAQQKDDPNAIAGNVRNVLLYGKHHPYGEITTEATVKKVAATDIRQYHTTYWRPNIAYLVFTGDINEAEAKQLAEKNFGAWAKGDVPKQSYPEVKAPAKTYIAFVHRPTSVQSVISIGAPVVLKPGATDVIPASVMATILGGGFSSRLNQNLREKYGFTYGAGGGLSPDKYVGQFTAGASVRNEKTDSAVGQFLYEFNRIQNTTASDSEVTALKNYMSGGFARSLEEPATVANFALNAARYNLPKDYYRNYLGKLAEVNATDVQRMANSYLPDEHVVITIVGNAKEAAAGLEKYGEVKYFDMYGNPVSSPMETRAVIGGTTPESILEKAITAYGGREAIAKVKDVIMLGDVSIMGQQLSFEQKNILPTAFSRTVSMNGMNLMKQSKKGDKYTMESQGAAEEADAATKEEMDAAAAFFDELMIVNNPAYKKEVKGIEQIDGKDAHHIAVTGPSGTTVQYFYDVASGLKVQEIREQDMGPMGKVNATTTIGDYKTFDGVKVPTKLSVDFGQFKQEVLIHTVKINTGLTGDLL